MKYIKEAELRDIQDKYLREEITFSRYCEMLNDVVASKVNNGYPAPFSGDMYAFIRVHALRFLTSEQRDMIKKDI